MSNNTIHDNRSTEGSPGGLMEWIGGRQIILWLIIATAAEIMQGHKKFEVSQSAP